MNMRFSEFPLISEVKEDYIELRRNGSNRLDATEKLKGEYSDELGIGEADDGLLFWIGLADGQYALKELTLEAAELAEKALQQLEKCVWGITPGDIQRKRMHYQLAPMPERKSVKPKPQFHCKWKIGDTFAYQLNGLKADALGISGQYVLMRKVAEVVFDKVNVFPVVTLSLWKAPPFPQNTQEFMSVPFVKLNRGRLRNPYDKFEYRGELIIKNKRELDSLSLIYLGNFDNVTMPDDEVIIECVDYMLTMISAKDLTEDVCIRVKLSRVYDSEISSKTGAAYRTEGSST